MTEFLFFQTTQKPSAKAETDQLVIIRNCKCKVCQCLDVFKSLQADGCDGFKKLLKEFQFG